MKKLLLLALFTLFTLCTLCFFTACSDDEENQPQDDKISYWKVLTRNSARFQINGDTLSSTGFSSSITLDSVYLQTQGNDMTLFTVKGDSVYCKSVTAIVLEDYPKFTFSDPTVLDTSYESGNSEYISFSGRTSTFSSAISFLFHETESTGKMGTINIDLIEDSLPLSGWKLSDEKLFVDWKSFFNF